MRFATNLKLLIYNCSKTTLNSSVLICGRLSQYKYHINNYNQNNSIIMRSSASLNNNNQKRSSVSSAITESDDDKQLTIGEKVKRTGKDVTSLSVIIIGVTVTGVILYTIFKELFSSGSPNVVYSQALKRCKTDARVIDVMGEPMKGFGEMTSRGRRRHVSCVNYQLEGVNFLRVKFYIKGSKRSGTVHVEVRENQRNKYEFRYLFVECDGFPQKTIILEDNRLITDRVNI